MSEDSGTYQTTPQDSLGAWIKRERTRRHWSMAVLADKIGVTVPYISRLESGEARNPSHAYFVALERELGPYLPDALIPEPGPALSLVDEVLARLAAALRPAMCAAVEHYSPATASAILALATRRIELAAYAIIEQPMSLLPPTPVPPDDERLTVQTPEERRFLAATGYQREPDE